MKSQTKLLGAISALTVGFAADLLEHGVHAEEPKAEADVQAPNIAEVQEPKAEGGARPENRETVSRLAQVHVDEGFAELRTGNAAGAVAAFERALALDPTHRMARFGLGTALISTRDFARSRNVLEALAAEFPDDYVIKNNLAWLFATAGDPKVRDGKKAIQYAQEAMLRAPHDYHVWSTLAEAYYVNERYTEALRAAEEALRLVREAVREANVLREYEQQVERCRRAVKAVSILE